jgi:enoyl-CoA hydratase
VEVLELPGLEVTAEGPIITVKLNRPDKLNAVNREMHHSLARVWGLIENLDDDARVVILTGAGRAFCAGGDLQWFDELRTNQDVRIHTLREAASIAREMAGFRLPVVAAVNGAATGLGCSLAVMCDIVLMGRSSFYMDPHVAVGLVAGDGGAAVWPAMTSLLAAKEHLLLGTRLGPDLAVSLGLANRVVPDDELSKTAGDIAAQLSELPPQAVQETKRALNLHLKRALDGVLDFALAAESESFLTAEHADAMSKFTSSAKKQS